MTAKIFSVGQYVSWGERLKEAHYCLEGQACSLPRDSLAWAQARQAFRALEDFRRSLDSMICDDVPSERDPRDFAVNVYYGTIHLKYRLADPVAFANDAFAGFQKTH